MPMRKLVERNVALIKANLDLARGFFDRQRDRLRWLPPMAGSVSLVEVLGEPAESFCRRLAQEHGVVLLPARFMGTDDRYVRMGFGRNDFAECLASFENAL